MFCNKISYDTQEFCGKLNYQFHGYSLKFCSKTAFSKIQENSEKKIQTYREKLANSLNLKKFHVFIY